ncbi:helix-turn-helix domain-containing protein [Halegenticoccus soli]|uniref:helix-turn-helix domain-containing protein n=1 Tax=Halegenticoccus soli TaxID=1985678 RepID=UPI0013043900|nr:helix-turn-helix domain-containing protein [Halegenticoccus soli]
MSVILEFEVATSNFELGKVLERHPETYVEVERIVPLSESILPLFWVYGEGRNDVDRTLRAEPLVNQVKRLDSLEDRTLYSIEWSPKVNSLVRAILDSGATLVSARGSAARWRLELRFENHADLSGFQRYCADHDIPLDVKRVYDPATPDTLPWYGLTRTQREALAAAFEAGYFDVPRRSTLSGVAERLGVSDQAASERIRRGTKKLVSNTLVVD